MSIIPMYTPAPAYEVFLAVSVELYDDEAARLAGLTLNDVPAQNETFYMPWGVPALPRAGDTVRVGPEQTAMFVAEVEWCVVAPSTVVVLIYPEPVRLTNYDEYVVLSRQLAESGFLSRQEWYDRQHD